MIAVRLALIPVSHYVVHQGAAQHIGDTVSTEGKGKWPMPTKEMGSVSGGTTQ